MVGLLALCPVAWNRIYAFISYSKAEQGYGEAWYQLAELATVMVRTFELEIMWARTFKKGVWPIRREEEEMLENIKLPKQLWIKHRLLGQRQYRSRGFPPPIELTLRRSDFAWAPWLEQRNSEFTIESLDNAVDWRDLPYLRGGILDW